MSLNRDKIFTFASEMTDSHVYYNTSFINNSAVPVLAQVTDTKTSPLIENPASWHLVIVRFRLSSLSLPIFQFIDGKYYVTLSYHGSDFTQPVVYVPYNYTSSTDRLVYSYSQFLNAINNAFAAAFTALKTAFPAAPQTKAPFLAYNEPIALFEMIAESSYDVSAADPITIWVNQYLEGFFPTFSWNFNGYNNANKKDYQLMIDDDGTNTAAGVTTFRQYSGSVGCWNDIVSLILTTTSLPVNPEFVSGKLVNAGNSSIASRKILTDFQPTVESGITDVAPQSSVVYQFTTQVFDRKIDLQSNTPISTVDLQWFWQDKYGNIFPIYLLPDEGFSVKLLFMKKAGLTGTLG